MYDLNKIHGLWCVVLAAIPLRRPEQLDHGPGGKWLRQLVPGPLQDYGRNS